MRFPQSLERDVIRSLVDYPNDCITFPERVYRNGTITVYRDGLAWRLPRYLYERMTGLPAPRYLLRVCSTPGCQNFHHYTASNRPYLVRKTCPNGHRYTKRNTLPPTTRDRCRRCRDERNARRRKGTGGRPGVCARGHNLTESNTYTWTDRHGILHRRCRRCTKQYQRNYRRDRAA